MGHEIVLFKSEEKKARNKIEIEWIVGDHDQG